MPILKEIQDIHAEMASWRQQLHEYPETAFEEVKTSDFVAEKLIEFGIEVSRSWSKTGVVGTLKNGSGLGLSLVRAVAQLHCADIELDDNLSGLRVVLRFEEQESNQV